MGPHSVVGRFSLAAAAAAAVLMAPATARAATTTIDFEDLAPGTQVTTQYLNAGGANQGVEFGKFNGASTGVKPEVELVPAGQASSGTHVADFYEPHNEFSTTLLWGTFPFEKERVRVFVGTPASSPGSFTVTLTAYGNNGQPLPGAGAEQTKTVTPGAGYKTMLEVTGAGIKFFRLAPATFIGNSPIVKVDDVSFNTPDPGDPPPQPTFGLSWAPLIPGLPLGVSKGDSVSTLLSINRSNGSNGDIQFGVDTPLPDGVSVKFSPNPVGGTDSTVTMTLTAAADSPTVETLEINAFGNPEDSAGAFTRNVKIPISVRLSNFDLMLNGIEVTQGIQSQEPPIDSYYRPGGSVPVGDQTFSFMEQTPGSCAADFPSLPARDTSDFSQPVTYGGVYLAQDKKTVARVYANVVSPENGTVEDVPALLYGTRNGKSLPGSPLSPDNGARDLPYTGRTFVNCRDRADPAGAYTFTLPDEWASGTLQLTAKVLPTEVLFGPGGECGTPNCLANNSLRLGSIDFTRTSYVTVTPVEMVYGGFGGADIEVRPPSPGKVFDDVRTLTPSRFYFVGGANDQSYAGVISIVDAVSDMNQELKDAADDDERKEIRSDTCSDILGQLEDWADDHPHGDLTTGVYRSVCPGVSDGSYHLIPNAEAFSVVEANRPRSSVAHELFHGMNRVHASVACGGGTGGQTGEPWAPDEEGHMHGIGFDPRSGAVLVPRVILGADPIGNGQPDEYHDFMSYCWTGEGATWNSDRGWNSTLTNLYAFQVLRMRSTSVGGALRAAQAGARLRVLAMADGNRVTITTVKPATGQPASDAADSPYTLVARDAAGAVLATVGMRAIESHVDGLGLRTLLRTDVPAAGVASLEIVRDGTVLASRARSPRGPSVQVLGPKGGARVGSGRNVEVAWRASDADGGELTAKVDYSTNGGRSFKTVFSGPSTGRARLPSTLFAGSRQARIRVRVSDGFNESSARSAVFTAVGRKPAVTIAAPAKGDRVTADARIYLDGSAYDDRGTRLTGRRLQWFAGRKRLGSGEMLSVAGLPAGRARIRLVARDARGRVGSRDVSVRVLAVAPQFIRLDAPDTVSAQAKNVVLRVASTIPATLRAGGKRFGLTRRTKRIKVPVTPGAGPLSLELVLSAGRKATRLRLVIPRA